MVLLLFLILFFIRFIRETRVFLLILGMKNCLISLEDTSFFIHMLHSRRRWWGRKLKVNQADESTQWMNKEGRMHWRRQKHHPCFTWNDAYFTCDTTTTIRCPVKGNIIGEQDEKDSLPSPGWWETRSFQSLLYWRWNGFRLLLNSGKYNRTKRHKEENCDIKYWWTKQATKDKSVSFDKNSVQKEEDSLPVCMKNMYKVSPAL